MPGPAAVVQIAEKVNAAYDKKVFGHTVHHSLLHLWPLTCKTMHADPSPPPRTPTMGM